jgi:hypothetical protein
VKELVSLGEAFGATVLCPVPKVTGVHSIFELSCVTLPAHHLIRA